MRAVLLALGACGFQGPIGATSNDDAPPIAHDDAPVADIGTTDGVVIDAAIDAAIIDGSAPDAAGPWLAGYSYRKPIVVNLGGATSLTDFPVAILDAADAELVAHAQAGGGDIVVTASDAVTVLATELVSYSAGNLELWVRVPTLAPTTKLYLYYGGPSATRNPTGVWSSLYAGVWHMSNATGATDSTSHAHAFTAVGLGGEPGAAVGVAGGARAFDGVKNQLVTPDPADGSLDFGSGSFSYSIWVDEVAAQQQYDLPLWKGGTSGGEPGYCMMLGIATWEAKVHDGNNFQDGVLGSEPAFQNKWTHLVAVVDRAGAKIRPYTNGMPQATAGIATIGSLSSSIGLYLGGPTFFHGAIDEVRIYTGILDPIWIAAEHANLATPGFVQIGAQQP